MRNNKELLQIAIDNIDLFTELELPGLCKYFYIMERKNIISQEEQKKLLDIIYKNIKKPSIFHSFILRRVNYKSFNSDILFFWKMRNVVPRLKYLKWLLKKQK